MKHSTDDPTGGGARVALALLALAVVTAGVAALGTPVRATRGGQVTADEPQYLLSAISLAEDADLDISDELAAERWRDFHEAQLPEQTKDLGGGRRVSPHDPLLPLLLAGPVALGGWVGAKLALSVVAGITAALTAWVAIRCFGVRPRVALPVTGVLFATAPLVIYGNQVYPEIVAALAVVSGVAALRGRLRPAGVAILGVAICALPWLAIKYAPVALALAALGVATLLRGGRRAAAIWLCAGLIVGGVAYVAVHLAVYGGVTPYAAGDHFVGGELTAVGSDPSYLGRARRLVGLIIDRQFGLAAWQPAWLLLIPAAALVAVQRRRGWLLVTVPLAAGWLTATFVALTMQGWWFPGRQVIVVLPLGVLLLAMAADRTAWLRRTFFVLGALGIWATAWLVSSGRAGQINWVVTFAEVPDPWYRTWSRLLPDYLQVSTGTWVRHGLWLTAVALLSWLAVRVAGSGSGSRGSGPPGSGLRRLDAGRAARGAPRRTSAGGAAGAPVLVDGPDVGTVVGRAARGAEAQPREQGGSGGAQGQSRHQETL